MGGFGIAPHGGYAAKKVAGAAGHGDSDVVTSLGVPLAASSVVDGGLPTAVAAQIVMAPKGDRLVVLSFESYCKLVSESLASKAEGEALSSEELAEIKNASTPLEFWRKKRGLSRAALASAVGISTVAIWQHERKHRGRSLELYGKLARILKVRIDDLYVNEEPAAPPPEKGGPGDDLGS